MTTTIQPMAPASLVEKHLRPIRLPHDLSVVADLIEMCFAPSLDEDGRRFIRQMRRAGKSARSYRNFHRLSPSIKGYVWEEDGKVIGNLNLIPVAVHNRHAYLIVNVSVHPNYRRRGIASALTSAGLALARTRGAAEAWLQVDDNNESAQHLYHNFGFTEQARRTVWHSGSYISKIHPPADIRITTRRRANWQSQKYWLDQLYPKNVRWNLPLNINIFSPGLLVRFTRYMSKYSFQQWSAYQNGQWIGSLSWQSSYAQADWLWLAAPPESRSRAAAALLPGAIQDLRSGKRISINRKLAINFPAGDSQTALEAAGFNQHQTLIWMKKDLK